MASFVEQATLKIDDQATKQLRSVNREVTSLIRNIKKLNGMKIADTRSLTNSIRQVNRLTAAINKIPKQRTVNVNVNQKGGNIPPGGRQPPGRNPPPPPPGRNPNSPWRNGTFAGVVRIATAYATFTGAVNIARAGVSATNESQAQDTRELSIFRNDAAMRDAINSAARQAALETSRLDLTRTRQIATDLALGGVGQSNLPQFTTLFGNTESAIGALFPGLEKSVTLFNNKMVNLANASDDIVRSSSLVRGGAQGIAAAGESFNAATSIAALRGSGLAPTINEKGLANFILLTDAMGQNISSGVTRLRKELFIPAEQAGAGSGIARGAVSNLNERGLRNYSTREQARFAQDPAGFIEEVLAPRIRARGVDTNDREALTKFVETAGFNATSQRLIIATLTSIDERQRQLQVVSGLDPSAPNAGTEGNLLLASNDLVKSFNTLSASILTPLFQAAAPFVTQFATFTEKVAITGSTMDKLGIAATAVAGSFAAFTVGKTLFNYVLNPLNSSAVALTGSAAALTNAAVALGGSSVTNGAAANAKGGGWKSFIGSLALTTGSIMGANTLINPGKELTDDTRLFKFGVDDLIRALLGTDKPQSRAPVPSQSNEQRFASLAAEKARIEENLSFAKQTGDINLIPQLQTELTNVNTAISQFETTFGTSVQQAGMSISTGFQEGANLLTGGLSGAFAAGAELIASRITNAINNASINAPRAQTASVNTGAVQPSE